MNATNATDTIPFSVVLAVATPDTVISLLIVSVRIVVLVLCVVWRNEQALKIRWPIPIVASLCLLLFYDSTKFIGQWSFSGAWPDESTFIRAMFVWPILVIIIIAFCHHYIRFYVLQYLNDAKLLEKNIQTRYFKALVSTPALITAIAVAALVLYPFSIIFATLSLVYPNLLSTLYLVVVLGNTAVCVVVVLLCVLICVNDFVRNIRNGVRVYFVEDPYVFRIEGLLSVISLILLVGFAILMILPRRAISLRDNLFMAQWIGGRIITLLVETLFCLLSGLLCVITIIIVKLRPVQSAVENETDLQKLLRVGGKGRKLFEAYIKSEFSSENMLCYNDLIKYHDKKSKEELTQLAHHLYGKYIKSGTLSEVNIPDYVRREYTVVMDSADVTVEQLSKLLESLEREVLVNLGDSFMRFKFTPTYKKLVGQE
jgi:hypothetical protein